MLKAEQMNIEGDWLMGMDPRSWMLRTVSGKSPGDPSSRCVTPAMRPSPVAMSRVYTQATCSPISLPCWSRAKEFAALLAHPLNGWKSVILLGQELQSREPQLLRHDLREQNSIEYELSMLDEPGPTVQANY